MTTDGGNWKELVRAATEGNLSILKYHLDMGIDPNFQHPEFMTTPLLEAVRAGRTESIKMLLEHPKNPADPTLVGDYEGQSPLEEAMQAKRHDIVDILLPILPPSYENECLTIWMTGTHHRDLVSHFLDAGHCVLITLEQQELLESVSALARILRKETGNKKLWITTQSTLKEFFGGKKSVDADDDWHPTAVDVWVHKPTNPEQLVTSLVSQLKPQDIPFRNKQPKILFLMDSKTFVSQTETQQQLAWLLSGAEKEEENNKAIESLCTAMLEPTTWWDNMTYSFWYQTWCESVLNLLVGLATERAGGTAKGKAYTYNRQSLVLPSVDARLFDDGVVKGWKMELESIAL